MKSKEHCFYLETIYTDNLKKKSYQLTREHSKDLSLKAVNDECLLNTKSKLRAKSVRGSPLPMKTLVKFRSPSKTPNLPPEKFPNPFNIRFIKLEEIRKKITSKLFNTNSDIPKIEYQAYPKHPKTRKKTPEKQPNTFFTPKPSLNYSSKLLKDQKDSNKVLEKFTHNSPFIAYFCTKNSPKLSQHSKLTQKNLLN